MDPLTGFSSGDGFLYADFTQWPASLRLRLDADRVLAPIGKGIASAVKKRLRKGQGAKGPLPKPKDAAAQVRRRKNRRRKVGRPLIRSGRLVKSIRYDKRKKIVHPMGYRNDLGAKLRGRQESLLWLLINTSRKRNGGKRMDPMGMDREVRKIIRVRADKAIARELKRPGYGLIAELRRKR